MKKDAFLHICDLPPTVDFAYKIVPGDTRGAKIHRAFLRAATVNPDNIRARRMFKSTTAINQERERHLRDCMNVIHPFSKIRQSWNTFMIFVYLFTFFITPIYVCFISTDYQKPHLWRLYDIIQCSLNLCDLAMNCCTGYVERTENIVLMPWKIFTHYLLTFFFFDLLSAIPMDGFLCLCFKVCPQCELIVSLRLLKYVRFVTFYKYICYAAEPLRLPFMIVEGVWMVLAAFYSVHFLGAISYYCSIMVVEYEDQTWVLQEIVLPSDNVVEKYFATFYRTSNIFFNLGYGLNLPQSIIDEILVTTIALVGASFFIISIGKVLQWAHVLYSSLSLYDKAMQQLQSYMDYKQLPVQLQKRLVHYYEFRYQENFFNETEIMSSLSSHLRTEIIVHSCSRLVENVSFFHNLPAVLLTRIVMCLRLEFYLANDVIIKAGAQGDSMYFISSGTVAIYTPTGTEVCHLEDGAHFGEVALVIESSQRVASVVAVESCQLYRLNGPEFRRAISPYPDLMARIERIAEERYERTAQLDDMSRRKARKLRKG